MKKSDSIVELAKALSELQVEMPIVPMNATNLFFNNSRYADLNSIIQTIKPILGKHGFSILQPNSSFVQDGITYVGVNTILMHNSGEWIEDSIFLPINDVKQTDDDNEQRDGDQKKKKKTPNHPQKAGIAITYLRRYGIASILGLSSEEDTDGNDTGHTSTARSEVGEMIGVVVKAGNKEKIASYREILKKYDPAGDANKISDQDLVKVLEEMKKLG